jgi:hypothetical protein
MNRKLKEIKTDYETKVSELNQKISETNKKCDILFEMLQDTQQQPYNIQQPVSSLRRRRKIVSNVLPDNFELPEIIPQMSSQPQSKSSPTQHQVPSQTQVSTQQKASSQPQVSTQPQKVSTPSEPPQSPFDLFSNIINIIEIAKPPQQASSEPKIEIVNENEDDEDIDEDIDEEIKEELDSLLEENNEEN